MKKKSSILQLICVSVIILNSEVWCDCPDPTGLPEGVTFTRRYASSYGTVVTFRCSDEDKEAVPIQWFCRSDVWDPNTVRCKEKECPEPPVIENGFILERDERLVKDSRVVYGCNKGFIIEDRNFKKCRKLNTGEMMWSVRSVTCIVDPNITCGPPPTDDTMYHNAERGKTSFSVGHEIQYTCKLGYIQAGIRERYCQADSTWSELHLECRSRVCGDPGHPSYGRRIGLVYSFGSRVTFECDTGYELKGRSTIYCQADGEWTSRRPECEALQCPELEPPAHGSTFGTDRSYGELVRVSCNDGYMLSKKKEKCSDNVIMIKCEENMQWDLWPITCLPLDCGNIVEYFPHGEVTYTHGTGVFSTANFRCIGYAKLYGNSFAQCQQNACWSKEPPQCLAKCRKEEIPNGRIEYHKSDPHWIRRRTYKNRMSDIVENGTVIEIACNSRFKKEGPREASCLNGTWLNLAKCIPNPCQVRHQPRTEYQYMNDSYVDIGTVVHGTQVKITCDINHHIEINNQEKKSGSLECDRGRWHFTNAFQQHEYQDLPQCKPDPCDQVHKGEGMTVRYTKQNGLSLYPEYGQKVQHGSSVILGCNEGYSGTPRHDFQSNCHQGSWNPDPDDFHCSPDPCKRPSYEENTDYTFTHDGSDASSRYDATVQHNTAVRVHCRQNHYMNVGGESLRDVTFQCKLGRWKNHVRQYNQDELPTCSPDPCDQVHKGDGMTAKYTRQNGWIFYPKYSEKVQHGSNVELNCGDGYYGTPQSDFRSSCHQGSWNPDPDEFHCSPDPCQVPAKEKNTEYTFTHNGFDVTSHSVATINHDQWVRVHCMPNHHINLQSQKPTEVTFQCKLGKWTNQRGYSDIQLPVCTPDLCNLVPLSEGQYSVYKDSNEWQFNPGIGPVNDGSKIVLQCSYGFSGRPDVDFTSTCKQGSWDPDPELFKCIHRPCPRLQRQRGVDVTYHDDKDADTPDDKVKHGGSLTATCQHGYSNPDGQSSLSSTCRKGVWYPPLNSISCSRDAGNTCIVDEETDGTEYHGGSTSEVNQGETVTVRCSRDYFMDLPSGIFHYVSLLCVNGKWQHNNKHYDELPRCKRESCKMLTFSGIDITYDTEEWLTMSSLEAYVKPNISITLQCSSESDELNVTNNKFVCKFGQWDPPGESYGCLPKKCKAVENAELVYNGTVITTLQVYDGKYSITCKEGYHRNRDTPEEIITCHGGEWSVNTSEICLPDSCNVVLSGNYSIKFGGREIELDTTTLRHGAEVKVRCAQHESEDEKMAVCQAGKWVPLLKDVCNTVRCKLMNTSKGWLVSAQTLDNITDSVKPNQSVFLQCPPGYELIPPGTSRNVQCKSDGTWNYTNYGQCMEKTCKLPDLQNGYYEGDHRHAKYLSHDETALFTCNAGYSFPEGDQPQVKCVLGEFEPSAPVCHEYCIIPNEVESSIIWIQPQMKPTKYNHGLYIVYKCQDQHQQELSTRCDKGTWIPRQPECEQQGCPNAETIEHGTVYKKIVNGLLLYHYCCDQDYILRGYPVLQCTNGHLNSTKPFCKAERVSGYYYQLHVNKIENGRSPYLDSQSINHNGMTELKLNCYRPRYGQNKYGVNWMYVDGSHNQDSVYVNNNIITFTGILQGKVTYRCTYWDPYGPTYTLSRCQTINFY